MKIEIDEQKPSHFKEYWPGQYHFFSHMEYAAGIPQPLFAISTLKENGKGNINFHAWGCFQGDEGGYFAVLPGICQHTHTFANIRRHGEFCVNFLSMKFYDNLSETVRHNGEEDDEFAAAGLTPELSTRIAVPRIGESFLSLECRLHSIADLSERGITAMIVGRVLNVAVEESYAHEIDGKYTDAGFMFNIHSPKDLITGEGTRTGVATLQVGKLL
jgi:flavin reductase (DIM6/NTAB) family NADH-FMN oxidoreductase RutF